MLDPAVADTYVNPISLMTYAKYVKFSHALASPRRIALTDLHEIGPLHGQLTKWIALGRVQQLAHKFNRSLWQLRKPRRFGRVARLLVSECKWREIGVRGPGLHDCLCGV